uniref:Large ribosomal subunit protein uL2m n=1 Tax=Gymnochlora stellata TaxID=67809 RepID=A0A140JZF5_GYMST|nr:50S ribosomal protein L2 [Gymnochlora stellata]BAU62482.1 50S ribosomal protein L2 [Gymnochlora stellata]
MHSKISNTIERHNGEKVDYKRTNLYKKGEVISFSYSPFINAKTCFVKYVDGDKKLLLCPAGLKIGDSVMSGIDLPLFVGNHLLLKNLPLGTDVHNIELYPGNGGKLARSGGSSANIIAKEGLFVTLRLPSGEVRLVSKYCWATVGKVTEKKSLNAPLMKAGKNRWVGKRPHVRGVVKNPVDHPHGGGEGRSPIGRSHPVTPWGRIALGQKTRRPRRYSDSLILIRRK